MAQAADDNPNINPSQAAQILEELGELRQEVEAANQNTNAFNQLMVDNAHPTFTSKG